MYLVESLKDSPHEIHLALFDESVDPNSFARVDSWHYMDRSQVSCPWFLKPYAIRECNLDVVMWLDNDVEIRNREVVDNYIEMWKMCRAPRLALAPDIYQEKQRGNPGMYNSGVVLRNRKPKILDEWVRACEISGRRGDQEALYAWIRRWPNSPLLSELALMSTQLNFQRLMMDMPEYEAAKKHAAIYHWTGPVGKQHLRENVIGN